MTYKKPELKEVHMVSNCVDKKKTNCSGSN